MTKTGQSYDYFRTLLGKAVSLKVTEKLLKAEELRHYKRGYETGCTCFVCESRRKYIFGQKTFPYRHRVVNETAEKKFKAEILGGSNDGVE